VVTDYNNVYAVQLGNRTNLENHSSPQCALQADSSLRVVIYSPTNVLFDGTEGNVATVALKANGIEDGIYQFKIKNTTISAVGSEETLADHIGYITVSNGVTAIDDVIFNEKSNSNTLIFDLQGRKVTTVSKNGIYITNGKKVLY
jgi:hypothetical protein